MGNQFAVLSHVTIHLCVKIYQLAAGQAVLIRKQWSIQLETSTLYCKGDKTDNQKGWNCVEIFFDVESEAAG